MAHSKKSSAIAEGSIPVRDSPLPPLTSGDHSLFDTPAARR
jgi:hypothetical protein